MISENGHLSFHMYRETFPNAMAMKIAYVLMEILGKLSSDINHSTLFFFFFFLTFCLSSILT